MNTYPEIMDPSTMNFFLYSIIIHSILVVLQAGLAGFLILSGILNIFLINPDIKLLRTLGLLPPIPEEKKNVHGSIRIILGVALLLPLIGVPYGVSGIAAILAFIFMIYEHRNRQTQVKNRGSLMRYAMMGLAFICSVSIFFDKADNLVAGKDFLFWGAFFRQEAIRIQIHGEKNTPKLGDLAPDFELSDPSGTKSIRLSDYRDKKPVVLVFGSFT
jgi:hypothetical protein